MKEEEDEDLPSYKQAVEGEVFSIIPADRETCKSSLELAEKEIQMVVCLSYTHKNAKQFGRWRNYATLIL